MAKERFMVLRGVPGACYEMSDWDGELTGSMKLAGWEVGRLAEVVHCVYRCPVNGDACRYSVQNVVDSTGYVVKQVPYHGPGAQSGEI